jgi:exosome complex RNA-binding protein Rrp42 (RNase PH superfamily)
MDCACIAAIAALQHARKNDVTIQDNEALLHPMDERHPIPLSIHHIPVCITFAFYDEGDIMVVDPDLLEEQLATSLITLTVNSNKELCAFSKMGGQPLYQNHLLTCANIAAIHCNQLNQLLRNVFKK